MAEESTEAEVAGDVPEHTEPLHVVKVGDIGGTTNVLAVSATPITLVSADSIDPSKHKLRANHYIDVISPCPPGPMGG